MARHYSADAPLSIRAQRFVEFLIASPTMNRELACANAGYSPRCAREQASQLMKDPRVQALLAERTKDRLDRMELTQEDVLRDLYLVATADSRSLTEYHIDCCRFCHGEDFKYLRTPSEWDTDLAQYLMRVGDADPLGLKFQQKGGVGYDPRKPPREDCPECHGRGVGHTVITDTRKLSRAAATLFAGVKETRHGTEINMRSKDKAIEMAARHVGVLKSDILIGNKDGKPFKTAGLVMAIGATDPIEAAREYQKIMGGEE